MRRKKLKRNAKNEVKARTAQRGENESAVEIAIEAERRETGTEIETEVGTVIAAERRGTEPETEAGIVDGREKDEEVGAGTDEVEAIAEEAGAAIREAEVVTAGVGVKIDPEEEAHVNGEEAEAEIRVEDEAGAVIDTEDAVAVETGETEIVGEAEVVNEEGGVGAGAVSAAEAEVVPEVAEVIDVAIGPVWNRIVQKGGERQPTKTRRLRILLIPVRKKTR